MENLRRESEPLGDVIGGRVLALLSDSVTTDHIAPAGTVKADSPARRYLQEHGVAPADFNSYRSRPDATGAGWQALSSGARVGRWRESVR